MVYYADLTPYRYEEAEPRLGVYHVGWLDAEHDYPQGKVSVELVHKLTELAATKAVRRMRGIHECELCSGREIRIVYEGRPHLLGCAEIWIPARSGEVYAAPDLIVHYVRDHDYLPPKQFLDAVADIDLATWCSPEESRW